jgi:exodeoxyribonuclease VII large subunit
MPSLFDLPFEDEPRDEGDRPPATTRVPDTTPQPDPDEVAPPRRVVPDGVITVSQLTTALRQVVEHAFPPLAVEGEISNCRTFGGHLYFTLKDATCQVRCVMFRSNVRQLKFKTEDGQHVIVRGRLGLYEAKGEYQLLCDRLEPQGVGALQVAFEQMKRRLEAEGLFDAARKRPLPPLPRRVGVVTSLDGAAIRDIITVLTARHPNVHLVVRPTRVQGEGAAADIARGLDAIARVPGLDLVIVGRGGGSIEDLWAFNEEVVARAIARCPLPVIAAVGHETDTTIADFVADVRAATPSAAAARVAELHDDACTALERHKQRLAAAISTRLLRARSRVQVAAGRPAFAGWPGRVALRSRQVGEALHRLRDAMRRRGDRERRRVEALRDRVDAADLRKRIGQTRTAFAAAHARLEAAMTRGSHARRSRLGALAGRLDALSPLGVLGRGYALCWDDQKQVLLRDAGAVGVGDPIRVTLARGEVRATVTSRTGDADA